MNNFIKGIIEETFASKAQQRFFYAKANEKGASKSEKKKWSKWANEFSKKTDFDKIPDKKEEIKDPNQVELEFDEIVDKDGNIATNTKPSNFNTKGVSDEWITDRVVKTASGMMGAPSKVGARTLRYWAEADMSKNLGAEETIMADADYDQAYHHFTKELGLTDDEAKERMAALGYEEKLPEDMIRLVENPKNFMEAYIESLLAKKKEKDNDIISNEIKEIHPIIKRQINSLKNSMKSHGLSAEDIKKHLEQDDE